jgi:hypothetical protein
MVSATQTPTQAPARTQKLRDLIEDTGCGMATADELHNALLELETTMGWTLTTPTETEDTE